MSMGGHFVLHGDRQKMEKRSDDLQKFGFESCSDEQDDEEGTEQNSGGSSETKLDRASSADQSYNNLFDWLANFALKTDDLKEEVQKIKRPYICDACGNQYQQENRLKSHIKIEHLKLSYECSICKEKLRSENQYRMHLRLHKNREPYVCNICGDSFSCQKNRRKHLVEHVRSGEGFECPMISCTKVFSSPVNQLEHLQNEHDISLTDPAKCRRCSMVFYTTHKLFDHFESSHRLFVRAENLLKDVSGVCSKLYKCQFCSEVFHSRELYQNHVALHKTTSKPYQCRFCNKTFFKLDNKNNHTMRHINKGTNFECPHRMCLMKFEKYDDLRNHVVSLHMDPLTCKKCDRIFKKGDRLLLHFYNEHFEVEELSLGRDPGTTSDSPGIISSDTSPKLPFSISNILKDSEPRRVPEQCLNPYDQLLLLIMPALSERVLSSIPSFNSPSYGSVSSSRSSSDTASSSASPTN